MCVGRVVDQCRYGRYYSEAGVEKRDLIKAYGIRFIIKVTGRAGKFSIVPLLLNIGSGIGLLAIVCEHSSFRNAIVQ
jgi:hypothetical protein